MAVAFRVVFAPAVALALVAAASSATAQKALPNAGPPAKFVPAPVGLDVDGTQYALVSNNLWKVQGLPAKQVKTLVKARTGATDAYGRQDDAVIWARTCTKAAQKVVFRRDLFMPGPPEDFAAYFETTDITHGPSVASIRLFINGRLARTITTTQIVNGNGKVRIQPTKLFFPKLFHFGLNTIEIEVTKRALNDKIAVGRCMSKGNPPTPFGVRFNLFGKFEADMYIPHFPKEPVHTVFGGTSHKVNLFAFSPGFCCALTNRGPSGVYRAAFSIVISASSVGELKITDVSWSGPGMGPCKVTMFGPAAAHIDCEINRWAAGKHPGVRVDFEVPIHKDFVYAKIGHTAELKSPGNNVDPNLNNNTYFWNLHLCRIDNPNVPPICDNPTGKPELNLITAD